MKVVACKKAVLIVIVIVIVISIFHIKAITTNHKCSVGSNSGFCYYYFYFRNCKIVPHI